MLSDILALDIYQFFFLVSRIGAALMVMPGWGSRMAPAKIRLGLTLAIAFLLLPVLGAQIPPMPKHPGGLVALIVPEVIVGGFLGLIAQALMASLHIAGTFIGFQTGLTNAFSFDTVAEQQSQLFTTFLANLALVVIFATDLHHLMLRAVVDSYTLFVPGAPLPLGDFAEMAGHTIGNAFALGLRMAAPVLVFGLVFYAGLGLLSRLVPQMQVFFVALPVQIGVGLWMMMVALPLMLALFRGFFEDGLMPFLTPR
ncbi:MAG: flagellar type III secretion system protein FliR [Magnetospirillum sp.]|nr:flagellar type III secretion system protein FliR [Magnetospirillum sp.]